MDIKIHQKNSIKIAELNSEGLAIKNSSDALDIMGNLYYQGVDKMIIHEKNLTPDFFNLRTGIAGEILQKFSNYRFRLAIVGDFSKYTGKSIKDFMYESNKGQHINFISSLPDALKVLS